MNATQDIISLEPGTTVGGDGVMNAPMGRLAGTSNRVDRYTLLGELGRGGMGVVYRAWDPQLDRTVALKMLLWGGMAGEVRRRRFMREAQAIARLEHPSIVTVHDSGVHEGCPYYTMDYVPGPTLQHRLDAEGPLTPEEALRLLAIIARALHHAHERGIVHRDVKPANILLEHGEHPRIADFGIAQLATADGDLTETGQIIGTPAYMAPEQALGLPGEIGPRTDVYSLGAVLYHLIAGRPSVNTREEALPVARSLEAPSLRRLDPRIPRDLDLICRKAMAPDPADRYASALALAEDAERFVRGEPVLASRPGALRRFRWQLRRYRALLTGVAVTLVVALAVAGTWRVVAQRRVDLAQRQREARAMERLEGLKIQLGALWKDGKEEEAARTLETFLDLNEIQETRALALALSFAGRRAREAGRLEEAFEHHARAWLVARVDEDKAGALFDLGRLFALSGDWARLRALEPILTRSVTMRPDLPGLDSFKRVMALSVRDLPQLSRLLSGRTAADFGPLLESLGTVRPTGFAPRELAWTAGGKVATFMPDNELQTTVLIVTGPGPAGGSSDLPLRVVKAPDGYRFGGPVIDLGLYQGEPLVSALLRRIEGHGTMGGLFRVRGSSLEMVHPLSLVDMGAASTADLDQDGVPEYYVTGGRQLFSIVRAPDGRLRTLAAHDETNRSNSDIHGLFAADLDGDGRLELVAASDCWRSYDVRVFRATSDPGRLELVASRRLGPLWNAEPFPLADGTMGIAAVRYEYEPNTRDFPASAPSGMPIGVYILRLRGDRLEVVEFVPAPFKDAILGRLVTGDFDGDGFTDFALQVQVSQVIKTSFQREDAYVQIVSRRPDGRLAQLTLPGLVPWHAMNLDRDAATELLARDQETGQLWVLGADGSSLPPLPREANGDAGNGQASSDDIWSRVDALASLGLTEVGVKELRHIAASTPDRNAAVSSLLRGGALMEANDDLAGAAALYREAVARDPGSWTALHRLATVSRSSKKYEVELEALTRLLTLPLLSGTERQGVEARLEQLKRYVGRPEVRLSFSSPVDAAWHFEAPHQLVRDASRHALVARTLPAQGDLARLPILLDGGPVTLEAALEIRRVEWGGVIDIGIRPAGTGPADYVAAIRISSGGGGDQPYKTVDLRVPGLNAAPLWHKPSRNPGEMLPMAIRLELDPDSGEVMMEARDFQRRYTLEDTHLTGPGRYELYIAGFPEGPRGYGVAEVGITSLVVRGARIEAVAPDPVQAAWRSMIEGRHGEAMAAGRALEHDRPEEAALVRYVAACRAGDRESCLTDLARLVRAGGLQEGRLRAIVRDQLRTSPSLIFSTLAGLAGFDALDLLYEVWFGPARAHPSDPFVAAALSACPSDADLARLPAQRTVEAAIMELELMSYQGQAWRFLGQSSTAVSRLEQARKLGESLLTRLREPDDRADVMRYLGQIEVSAARAYARTGQVAPVLDHLRKAIERSPTPRLLAEETAVLPEIEALLDEPGIRALLNPSSYEPPAGPLPRGLE